jgi:hypothetical protein
MKRFTIFHQATSGSKEAVKSGWSWPAFFFGIAWALSRGMPGVALALLAAQFVVGLLLGGVLAGAGEEALDFAGFVFGLVYSSICGANGNEWRRSSLARRGYSAVGGVDAESPEAALALPGHGAAGVAIAPTVSAVEPSTPRVPA